MTERFDNIRFSHIKKGEEALYASKWDYLFSVVRNCQKKINLLIDDIKEFTLYCKDRFYDSKYPDGMGLVVIKKNKPFRKQFEYPNTIYVIQYDFDLKDLEEGEREGEERSKIIIPENCILEFNGGSLINGIIKGNNTGIRADIVNIFGTNIKLEGTWNFEEAYVEWFGAKGDWKTDDTISIRRAIYNLNKKTIPLIFQNYKKYKISDTLNYDDKWTRNYFNMNIILKGVDFRQFPENPEKECGILLTNKNIAIFKNAQEIVGRMEGLRIICVTEEQDNNDLDSTYIAENNYFAEDGSSIFYNCETYRFTFEKCYVSSFNTFAINTCFYYMTRIQYNYIKSFNFIYNTTILNSFIDNNQIVGIPDNNSSYIHINNTYFNSVECIGSYIRNNLIKYYNIIFNNCSGNINSSGNQYQVFKYFYKDVYTLNSVGDSFTQGDSYDSVMSKFTSNSYVGQNGSSYFIPPYVLCITNYIQICIKDCILGDNLTNVIFIQSTIKNFVTKIEFTCNESSQLILNNNNSIPIERLKGAGEGIYDISDVPSSMQLNLDRHTITTVQSLPTIHEEEKIINGSRVTGVFSDYLLGEKVKLSSNNCIYTLQKLYRKDDIWAYEWVQDSLLHKELTKVIRNTVLKIRGNINMQYSFYYIGTDTDEYDTISSITIPESLYYIPLSIYNYSNNNIKITALKYQGENIILKPEQCCVFMHCYDNNIRVISVSTPDSNIHRGTLNDAKALVSGRKINQPVDIGYSFFAYDSTTKYFRNIYYSGNSNFPWVKSDGTSIDTSLFGSYNAKPTVLNHNIPIGFPYFCTDLNFIIYHKGNDIWVKSDGLDPEIPLSGVYDDRPVSSYFDIPIGFPYYCTDLMYIIYYVEDDIWIKSDGTYTETPLYGFYEDRPTIEYNNIPVGFSYFCTDQTDLGCMIYHVGNDKWVKGDGTSVDIPLYGLYENKPTSEHYNIPISFSYFCTDKQTVEGKNNGIMIYYKGQNIDDDSDIWIDALGRIVDDNYPEKYIGTFANRPTLTANDAGWEYRDTTNHRIIIWSGTAWVDALGQTININ